MDRRVLWFGIITQTACVCVSTPDEQAATFDPIQDGGTAANAELKAAGNACGIELRYALQAESDDRVRAQLLLGDAAFHEGSNDFVVDLNAEDGTAATLTEVSAFMPAHGHGASAARIERRTAGYCVGALPLLMPGRWQLTLTVRADGEAENIVIPVDVR